MKKKILYWGIKVVLSLLIIWTAYTTVIFEGENAYTTFRDYSYENLTEGVRHKKTPEELELEAKLQEMLDAAKEEGIFLAYDEEIGDFVEVSEEEAAKANEKEPDEIEKKYMEVNSVEQHFTSRGNVFGYIEIYMDEKPAKDIEVKLYPADDEKASVKTAIKKADVREEEFNRITGLSDVTLERGKEYVLSLSSKAAFTIKTVDPSDKEVVMGDCMVDGKKIDDTLTMNLAYTYKYMTKGAVCVRTVRTVMIVLLTLMMLYAVIFFEKIFASYKEASGQSRKHAAFGAFFFAASSALMRNPLEKTGLTVTEFKRVIGEGIIANVDVSKRTESFTHWFILFAVSFILLYTLFTHIYHTAEDSAFLKDYMILADCTLLIRAFTFFYYEGGRAAVYSFTTYAVLLIGFIIVSYHLLGIEKKMSPDAFGRMEFIASCISLPTAIFISNEWEEGRYYLLIWTVLSIAVAAVSRLVPKFEAPDIIRRSANFAAALPLITSLFIELVHIKNQRGSYIEHPAVNYVWTVVIYTVLSVAIIVLMQLFLKRKKEIAVHLPVFILGVSCLSVQLPMTAEYEPDLYESANYGVLISDFLSHGRLPIAEHYGGHMMTGVWEGILYGLINKDTYGAAMSPYSVLITPVIALLFFFLIKEIWNEKIAAAVALLFPFYEWFSYYGLGAFAVLAAVAYVKKNTWLRAALIWAAAVWCALYRLDLGFAFGAALILAMGTYIIKEKNLKALLQLGVTLAAWAVIGLILWCIMCSAAGVSPVDRLKEFLLITMSNQNWAYNGIGDMESFGFGWTYILIPFAVMAGLFITTITDRIENKAHRIILLILGWSYMANYTRGLVRHSLAELTTTFAVWTGYIFIAVFIALYRDKKQLVLPVFCGLTLANMFFMPGGKDTWTVWTPIADNAVSVPSDATSLWKTTRFSEEEYEDERHEQDLRKEAGKEIDEKDILPEEYMPYYEWLKSASKKEERVKLSEDTLKYVKHLQPVLDMLLKDDETYVDFMNRTMLFPLVEREDPVYVSQSPLQLSGEYTQEEFIKEIKGVPLVLLPIDSENYRASNSFDGITNIYRDYLISEYIYENYEPLCMYEEEYAVWCLSDKKEAFEKKLDKYIKAEEKKSKKREEKEISLEKTDFDIEKFSAIDYGYDGPEREAEEGEETIIEYIPGIHQHALNELPRIWAEADEEGAASNKVLAEAEYKEGIYSFDKKKIEKADKKNGNYLLIEATLDSESTRGRIDPDDEKANATLILGKKDKDDIKERCRYDLTLTEGTHKYLIRISTDYYWYQNEINALRIESEGDPYDITVKLLAGDK